MIAKVAVDTKTTFADRIFDYNVPEYLLSRAKAGARCEVPFGGGNRRYMGFILSLSDGDGEGKKLKDIIGIIDDEPFLDRTKLLEAYWIKNRYFCTFADAIKLFMPAGLKTSVSERIGLVSDKCTDSLKLNPEERRILEYLSENGESLYDKMAGFFGKSIRSSVKNLEKNGLVYLNYNRDTGADKYVTVVSLADKNFDADSLKKTASAQRRVIKVLSECDFLSIPDICMFAGCSANTITALHKKGILIKEKIEVLRTPRAGLSKTESDKVKLTGEQKSVLDVIEKSRESLKKPVLLRGVTGSGKTEVYLRAIESVLKENKSAIVLVPEISLTYQMMSRFLSRFGHSVALLHSSLSDGERYDEWKRIKSGAARVVLGARSAVFAPCKNLGIIIIDEEHEDTYKAERGAAYDAREVARMRAVHEKALLVLSSATPSVEDYYRAKSGEFTLCEMNKRYNGVSLPKTYIADMREELRSGNRSPFSEILKDEILNNLSNGEQTILLLNRRGYSTFVSCRSCGHVEVCPHCNISLTYHSHGSFLMCHYCGYKKNVPEKCPECEKGTLRGFGTGTQKIEEKLFEEFPAAGVIRMDVDTTAKKDAREKILDSFENDNLDILLGTQMISKGLDFKNVSLVGVLAADQALNMGDYRAAERTFDLITQVCGRSGRGDKRGRAVIQTYQPENKVIELASRHDYLGFYEEEIVLRRALCYPPFCNIIDITVTGSSEEKVKNTAVSMQNEVSLKFKDFDGISIYRAAPCFIDKIENKYRWHFWLKCHLNKEIHDILEEIMLKAKGVGVSARLNPNTI
ncbi:MAG: primosomal protein N' [Clostridia bacterium]|nr:primosomal protein N' [Clostridia bacterium]